MSETDDNSGVSRRRPKRKSYALLILAAGIFLFGIAAGTLYWFLQPTTLRIAVGPPNSDDQKPPKPSPEPPPRLKALHKFLAYG